MTSENKENFVNIVKELGEPILVSKLEVAKRQLIASVRMLFNDWDPVPTHTIVSAAHQLVHDLCKKTEKISLIKDNPFIVPSQKRSFINGINRAQNFFKHAEKDRDSKLPFRKGFTIFYLFDAIRMYILLTGDTFKEARVFLFWFQIKYPHLIIFDAAEQDLRQIRESTKDPETYKILARYLLEKND